MKGITQKDYQVLILNCIDNSSYEDTLLFTDEDAIKFATKTIYNELGWMVKEQGRSQQDMCLHWLQGLASACTIPFTNHYIVKWGESVLGRTMTDKEVDKILEEYWINASQALNVLINRYGK